MKPFSQKKYSDLKEQLTVVPFNCFYARSVIERHVNGTVYVDNTDNPKNAYILHPYGMSLLLGDGKNIEFNNWLFDYMLNKHNQRKTDEWMQVFSDNLRLLIERKLKNDLLPAEKNYSLNYQDFIEVNTRVNFKFNKTLYREKQSNTNSKGIVVERLNKETTLSMRGCVIPLNFWNNVDEFLENGIGYSVMVNNEQASTAHSSFVHGKYLEIGIETVERFRGFGYAKLACSALIEYCIENHLEPIWSCRLENIGSYKLAMSLGFEPTLHLPYYRLCKNE